MMQCSKGSCDYECLMLEVKTLREEKERLVNHKDELITDLEARLAECKNSVKKLNNMLVNANRKLGVVAAPYSMTITQLCEKQFDWVERMGWHNKTVLEALALVGSEVGEAVNECRGEKPTKLLGTELADIILRVTDLAQWQGIDLNQCIVNKMKLNEQNGTRGRRV